MKINYLLFLSVRNLTAIVRLDNAETINISKSSQEMLLSAKQPSPPHPPPPKKENYFVRKFMVCLFIYSLNLGYGQCSLLLSRLLFSAWGCWKEDRRQHEKKDALLSLRPSRVNTGPSKARFRRRSTHVPNLIELGSTLERHWPDSWFRRRTVCRT